MADFLPGRGCAQANFSQLLRRENAEMAAFLRRCLEVGDRGRTIEQIRDGKAKPSQQLADAVERMLKGNTEFELIDEQKVVDEKALALARHLREGRHCVLLVPGRDVNSPSTSQEDPLMKSTQKTPFQKLKLLSLACWVGQSALMTGCHPMRYGLQNLVIFSNHTCPLPLVQGLMEHLLIVQLFYSL